MSEALNSPCREKAAATNEELSSPHPASAKKVVGGGVLTRKWTISVCHPTIKSTYCGASTLSKGRARNSTAAAQPQAAYRAAQQVRSKAKIRKATSPRKKGPYPAPFHPEMHLRGG
jgi:hypothetical protein